MAVIEIERKFLVREAPTDLTEWLPTAIMQGYLFGTDEGVHVRLRAAGGRRWLTIKHGSGPVRTEVEVELTPEQFDALWPLTGSTRLEKVRYARLHDDGLVYELDVYGGPLAGLRICEVEFASVEAAGAFTPPDWFGAEVTSDLRYSNYSLARAQAVPV
ncbi:MAG TPA: CYTH domain-containing protein [Rhodothermales bacterium]|nr:CYTH domain-containing protein [Rhodothermales bacterium]